MSLRGASGDRLLSEQFRLKFYTYSQEPLPSATAGVKMSFSSFTAPAAVWRLVWSGCHGLWCQDAAQLAQGSPETQQILPRLQAPG